MAYIVMAYRGMVYIVMAYVVAYRRMYKYCLETHGLFDLTGSYTSSLFIAAGCLLAAAWALQLPLSAQKTPAGAQTDFFLASEHEDGERRGPVSV